MSAAVRENLERLRDRIDADSISEVIRRAVTVYDLLSIEHEKGGRPVLRYPDESERELLLEFPRIESAD